MVLEHITQSLKQIVTWGKKATTSKKFATNKTNYDVKKDKLTKEQAKDFNKGSSKIPKKIYTIGPLQTIAAPSSTRDPIDMHLTP